MADTDFFDDDLAQRGAPSMTPSGGGVSMPKHIPSQKVSDLNLTKMARHRQMVDEERARAAEELEMLKQREQDIERKKREMEDLRKKHDDYELGKQELLERLSQNLATLEKDEIRSGQITELLSDTRRRFKAMRDDLDSIDEESWEESRMRQELTKSLALIEDARMEFNKSIAKIQAMTEGYQRSQEAEPVLSEGRATVQPAAEKSLGYWFKVGMAVSLPLILFLLILTVVHLVLRSQGFI